MFTPFGVVAGDSAPKLEMSESHGRNGYPLDYSSRFEIKHNPRMYVTASKWRTEPNGSEPCFRARN